MGRIISDLSPQEGTLWCHRVHRGRNSSLEAEAPSNASDFVVGFGAVNQNLLSFLVRHHNKVECLQPVFGSTAAMPLFQQPLLHSWPVSPGKRYVVAEFLHSSPVD
jgi:hypothetical protein